MRSDRFKVFRGVMAWGFMILGLLLVQPAAASGGGNKGGAVEGINYIPITPALVVNYGGPGRARYLKIELSIRSENAVDANVVMHNLPLVRDRLISIFSAQTDEIVSSPEGKEYLRLYALAEINKALLQVQGLSLSSTAMSAPASAAELAATASMAAASAPTSLDQLPVVTPVIGPASDLYFNNFVVQR